MLGVSWSTSEPLASAIRAPLFVIVVAAVACQPKAIEGAAPSAPPMPSGRAARVVNATVLANGCQELGQANARIAERAMYQLVEGCTSVPGGTAEFQATLLPSGRIEIAAGPGQPDVVPICILKHSLTHDVRLGKPCRLDVKIEQTSVPVTLDGGASPSHTQQERPAP